MNPGVWLFPKACWVLHFQEHIFAIRVINDITKAYIFHLPGSFPHIFNSTYNRFSTDIQVVSTARPRNCDLKKHIPWRVLDSLNYRYPAESKIENRCFRVEQRMHSMPVRLTFLHGPLTGTVDTACGKGMKAALQQFTLTERTRKNSRSVSSCWWDGAGFFSGQRKNILVKNVPVFLRGGPHNKRCFWNVVDGIFCTGDSALKIVEMSFSSEIWMFFHEWRNHIRILQIVLRRASGWRIIIRFRIKPRIPLF